MHVANAYSLTDAKRHYFRGPISDTENTFRTVPDLLRRVADWMDEIDLQDVEFRDLVVRVEFATEDDFYQTATVYYAPPETRKR